MKNLDKLIKSMPKEKDIYGNVIAPTVFIGENDHGKKRIMLSAEEADSYYFADYYGEFRGGYPWVNPALEQWAKDRGLYWEWQNPAVLGLYEI